MFFCLHISIMAVMLCSSVSTFPLYGGDVMFFCLHKIHYGGDVMFFLHKIHYGGDVMFFCLHKIHYGGNVLFFCLHKIHYGGDVLSNSIMFFCLHFSIMTVMFDLTVLCSSVSTFSLWW